VPVFRSSLSPDSLLLVCFFEVTYFPGRRGRGLFLSFPNPLADIVPAAHVGINRAVILGIVAVIVSAKGQVSRGL